LKKRCSSKLMSIVDWTRGDYFQFGLVFIKKSNQIGFFYKKIETEPESVQTNLLRFGYFRTKTNSNRFGSVFFLIWLVFFNLTYKTETEPNRTSRFLKNSNWFFLRFGFFGYVFLVFSI